MFLTTDQRRLLQQERNQQDLKDHSVRVKEEIAKFSEGKQAHPFLLPSARPASAPKALSSVVVDISGAPLSYVCPVFPSFVHSQQLTDEERAQLDAWELPVHSAFALCEACPASISSFPILPAMCACREGSLAVTNVPVSFSYAVVLSSLCNDHALTEAAAVRALTEVPQITLTLHLSPTLLNCTHSHCHVHHSLTPSLSLCCVVTSVPLSSPTLLGRGSMSLVYLTSSYLHLLRLLWLPGYLLGLYMLGRRRRDVREERTRQRTVAPQHS